LFWEKVNKMAFGLGPLDLVLFFPEPKSNFGIARAFIAIIDKKEFIRYVYANHQYHN